MVLPLILSITLRASSVFSVAMHIHTIINQVQDFIHILPVPSFQKIIQKLQINFTIGRRSENQKCII